MQNKKHWEKIFESKEDVQKSWYQDFPVTSIQFFKELNIPKSAAIIDVGGGDSRLVDALLEEGYTNITVLDISAIALKKAKTRLGSKVEKVKWIEADVLDFSPSEKYDFWHDRAVFHFVIDEKDIEKYKRVMYNSVEQKGHVVIATFSPAAPESCSGLLVKRYSEQELVKTVSPFLRKLKCKYEDHITPFNTLQSFTFCSFLRCP